MAKALLVGIIVVLIIAIVIALIAALWLRQDFINCENSESPWCPQFTCPSTDGPGNGKGQPATRTDANGNIQHSG
jgi:hypothetical protein